MTTRRSKVWLTALVVLGLATTFYLRSNRYIANDDPTRYHITLTGAHPDRAAAKVEVEASFTLEDTLLYTTHEGLDPKAYAPFIRNVQVRGAGGERFTVTPCTLQQPLRCNLLNGWERGQKWLVDARAGTPVTLSYEVALEHDRSEWPAGLDSAAFRTGNGVFFTGRALFLMNGRIRSPFVTANLAWMEGVLVPREDSREAIEVSFSLPDGWRASTPWVPTEQGFVADDLIALSESMLMLGTQDTRQTEQSGTALTLALGGETVLSAGERLQKAFREAHSYYTGVFGGPPKTSRENPLKRAIVVVNSGDVIDGEVIGNNLSVTFAEDQPIFSVSRRETQPDSPVVLPLQVVFHEFFHLWNGITFASATEAEWFKEGVTDFYALRAARQLGYLDRATFITLLGDQYRRHLAARAASELSLTEAGKDEFAQHELLYPGGLLVGLSLDLIIRTETANDKSLDDLMRRVYAEYGASGKALSTEAVQGFAEALTNTDLTDFFARYVTGSEAIPLTDYLKLAGLDATFANGRLRVVADEAAPVLATEVRASVF